MFGRMFFIGTLLGTWAITAPDSKASDPIFLEVAPATVTLRGPRAAAQVVVTGKSKDGDLVDLTREAEFSATPLVRIESGGYLSARQDGEAELEVRARGQFAKLRLTVAEINNPGQVVSFRREVVPALSLAGCNQGACHGTPSGKNGFRLSLRGSEPTSDLVALTRDQFGRRINREDPASSLILLKGRGAIPHEGGIRWIAGSRTHETVLDWLRSTGADDARDLPLLSGITVVPGSRILREPAREQQLAVIAKWSDGQTSDMTRLTVFSSSDPSVATVATTGLVTFHKPGEVAVLCRYQDSMASVRLTYLAPRSDFAWPEEAAEHPVDLAVNAKLKMLQITPASLCNDAVFLRRITLDLTGKLPTPNEIRAFVDESAPDKRAKWADRLLASQGFAEFWALKWSDLLRVGRKTMDTKGAFALHAWLRDRLASNAPLDQTVRELVTAKGSTAVEPAANLFRVIRDPQALGEAAAQLFCGVRLQCAKCHNHPFERWTQDDYLGMAAFFARVRLRPDPGLAPPKGLAPSEVVLADRIGEIKHPRTGQPISPKPLTGQPMDVLLDRRSALADWLTSPENPFFARSIANRVWFHLFGRGIVEPVDDFRESNPSANDELLELLDKDFAANRFDLRKLVRLIVTSRAYQRESGSLPLHADEIRYFARITSRPMTAEQLLDAVCDVTEIPEKMAGFPVGTRIVQLPDGENAHPFLQAFGQPQRQLVCECERESECSLAQALQMVTGPTVGDKLRAANNRIGRLLAAKASEPAILKELSLIVYGRRPTEAEKAQCREYLAGAKEVRRAWEDLLWAMLNSQEFLMRR